MIRPGRYAVCPYDELAEASACKVRAGGMLVAVFKVRGEVKALADTCSHAQASLSEGEVNPNFCTVMCPLHGAIFDLDTGEPLSSPATAPVETFDCEIDDGQIVVTIL